MARYNYNGSLDKKFNGTGKLTTDFFGNGSNAFAVAIQPDEKILVAGTAENTSRSLSDFALARFDLDGTLDTTFNKTGKVTAELSGADSALRAVVLQRDGRIVVLGDSGGPGGAFFVLQRYNSDGSLDSSFGGGTVSFNFGGGSLHASAVLIQPDGKIIAVGYANNNFALARFDSKGALDPAFGNKGKVVTNFGMGSNQAFAAALYATTGKIVVAGGVQSGELALARYNNDGSLDTSFGPPPGGKVVVPNSPSAHAITIAPLTGTILAAGSSVATPRGDSDFALTRLKTDGTLDTAFGNGGVVLTDFSGTGSSELANAMVTTPQYNRTVVAGSTDATDPNGDFALARYIGN